MRRSMTDEPRGQARPGPGRRAPTAAQGPAQTPAPGPALTPAPARIPALAPAPTPGEGR